MTPRRVVDLFAGPGGWEADSEDLIGKPIGIEHDASACLTRAAAGHLTIRQDVTTLDTARFRPLEGLIASPPCPTFSAAGNRAGIAELRYIIEHVHACTYGWRPYVSPMVDADPRSALVLEPLRFALECVPQWIALEQVPDVLPVWEAYAHVLRAHSWSVWCGILNAADYGVPQTRRRAILIAHRKRDMAPPEPTHCEGGAQTLLGELAPWVSMAEALGWDGFDARYQRGAGLIERHGERPDRPCEEPAPTLTGSALGAGAGAKLGLVMRAGAQAHARTMDQPAPTITSSMDNGDTKFVLHTNRGQDEDGNRQTRDTSAPAPALSAKAGGQWAFDRPATTVQGDPRLAPPGHRDREGGEPQFGEDALRLTVEDALRLQSFDASYPVEGTKTKKFEQIGNAVPPKLARAVLGVLEGGSPCP